MISWPSFRRRKPKPIFAAGLQGKGLSNRLDVPVAVMIPMVSMMYADKSQHRTELECIQTICAESPIFQRPSRRDINAWMVEARKHIREEGGDEKACREAKLVLTKPLRETTYAFAVKVLFADEKVKDAEKDRAENMAGWLDVDRDLASDIVRVISILRHGRDSL